LAEAIVTSGKTNVRELSTTFFGRAAELAALDALFAGGDRLVTLLGPAGCGKTRLAKRHAAVHAARPANPGGAWFCDLSDARSGDAVMTCVAKALGLSLARSQAEGVGELGRALDARGPVLLVLDNCEQVTQDVASILTEWLGAAAEARFLATSRERLRTPGERIFELRPLPVPVGEDDLAPHDSVALFVDRARLVCPEYLLRDSERRTVARIVRALDGLPLALELAAARIRVMNERALLGRLDKRLDLLADPRPGVPRHHATLRAAIDWSWDLLTEWERAALAQCSAFRGGFTVDAAEAVLDLSAFAGSPSVVDAVQALRDKSLLHADAAGSTTDLRLGLYESVLEYATERLGESRQAEAAFARHAAHFLATGEALAERARVGSREDFGRLELELANLRAVHDRATGRRPMEALRASLILAEIYRRVGTSDAMTTMLDAAIEAATGAQSGTSADRSLLADGLLRRAWVHYRFGRPAEARTDAQEGLRLARAAGDVYREALAEHRLGLLAWEESGQPLGESLVHLETASRMFASIDRPAEESWALTDVAIARGKTGEAVAARRLLQRAIAVAERAGAEAAAADAGSALGVIALELGLHAEAQSALDAATAAFFRLGDSPSYYMSLVYRGYLHFECGEVDRAERVYRELLDGRSGVYPFVRGQTFAALGVLLAGRGAVDDAAAAFDRADAQLAGVGGEWAVSAVVSRGHLDLARARKAATSGEDPEPHRERARARLAVGAEWATRSDEVRLALRWLERVLETGTSEKPYPRDALVVAEDAAWFRVPFGWRVDIASRNHERALLRALARGRVDTPGRPLTREELLDAGWPGERIRPQRAGANRVHVALSTLRQLGLRDVLRSADRGHFIDPTVPTIVAPGVGLKTRPK
jgi:predicted ATPase